MKRVLLHVDELRTHFPIRSGVFSRVTGSVKAVDGVSFTVNSGETLGLVGESGCGKTTVGRTILRLTDKTSGSVTFDGIDIYSLDRKSLRKIRPRMQLIFQDPYSSLSPRLPVHELIGEAVRCHGTVPEAQYREYIDSVMESCGLSPDVRNRYPHEFSGGQRQRICIARALALRPEFIVCDEPVSALDVSVQAQIINLLCELREKSGMAYLFISHDLSVVEHISDRVGVMYLGSIVEYAPKSSLFGEPMHPYTRALLSSIPGRNKGGRITLNGNPPSPASPPEGCRFHTRCPYAMKRCAEEYPGLLDTGDGHFVRCHAVNG